MNNTVVTCVYCGHEYPDGTPTAKAALLTEHIKVCEKHPMRKAEATIKLLRDALAGLVGSDIPAELAEMTAFGAFVEGVRNWGRAERAKLGL